MSSLKSLFAGIDKADATQERNKFIAPGRYVCQVIKCKAGTSQKGQDFFLSELRVVKLLEEFVAENLTYRNMAGETLELPRGQYPDPSNKEGTSVTWYNGIQRGQMREASLGRIKGFIGAAVASKLGQSLEDVIPQITGEMAAEACEGEGTQLEGAMLEVVADYRPTRAGKAFAVCTFTPWEDSE